MLHLLIWGMPTRADAPFNAHRSPFLGDVRVVSTVGAVVAGVALISAGIAFVTDVDWWWVAAVAGASLSAAVMLLTFTPWWLLALAIDAAIVALALRSQAGC
jgi:hypothetical protein